MAARGSGPDRAHSHLHAQGHLHETLHENLHGHSHGHAASAAPPEDPRVVRRVRLGLAAVVVPLLLAMAAAMAVLWPRGDLPDPPEARDAYEGVIFATAQVRAVRAADCPGGVGDRLPDGTIPRTTTCHTVEAELASGPEAGRTVSFGISPDVARSGVRIGDRFQVARYPAVDGEPVRYAFVDFAREVPLAVLALAFALLVVLVARLRGLMSLVGLLLAFATIGWFVLPALRHQADPVLVGAVASTVIMSLILYLAHGVTRKTTTALLGTVAGIWTSAALAGAVTGVAHLNGLTSEENVQLNRMTPFGDLSGLITCGIILAGLGVLNDVTITQASAVWEFHRLAPAQPVRSLFASGMQVGRDHLASIVYTLAFAYVGAALPSILLGTLYGRPLRQWLTSGEIGEEIARALVASFGLILAIPLTTLIGCIVVRGLASGAGVGPTGRTPPTSHPPSGRRAAGVPVRQPDRDDVRRES